MATPSGFTVEEMVDVLSESKVVYRVSVDADAHGSPILVVYQDLDGYYEAVAWIAIENHVGDLYLIYYNKDAMEAGMDEPSMHMTLWRPEK